MNSSQHSQVLVAGAGPVGMMAALELARKGVDVAIIDQDAGPTVRSYACLLHAKSFRLLKEAGAGEAVLSRGKRVDRIAFSDTDGSRHELHLSSGPGPDSFVVILPQSDLEEILQERLADYGVEIQWQHRLTDLEAQRDDVVAGISLLSDSGKGYAVPHMDRIVSKTIQRSAKFLIGADGRDSHVRELLGIRLKPAGESEYFAAFEFETDQWPDDELCIALHQRDGGREEGANLVARLPNGRGRGVFQCAPEDLDIETHLKDRVRFRIVQPGHDGELLSQLKEMIETRAPGFELDAGAVEWHGLMEVPNSLVTRFGYERCWLAGDAAHLANPIGMHSMNAGLAEAAELARIVADSNTETESAAHLRAFNEGFHSDWKNRFEMPDKRQRALAGALPATGDEFEALLRQLEHAPDRLAAIQRT